MSTQIVFVSGVRTERNSACNNLLEHWTVLLHRAFDKALVKAKMNPALDAVMDTTKGPNVILHQLHIGSHEENMDDRRAVLMGKNLAKAVVSRDISTFGVLQMPVSTSCCMSYSNISCLRGVSGYQLIPYPGAPDGTVYRFDVIGRVNG